MKKRLFSLLLTAALCLSLLPVPALAEEPGEADSEVVETSLGADIKDNGDIGSDAGSPDSTEEPEGGDPPYRRYRPAPPCSPRKTWRRSPSTA